MNNINTTLIFNHTLNRPLEPNEVLVFGDIVKDFCSFYDQTLATCAVLVLVMYVLKEYFYKQALQQWEHPNYPLKFIIPRDVRDGIVYLLKILGHVIEACGAMAAGYLVYFAYNEGMLTGVHTVLLIVAAGFITITIILAGVRYLEEQRK